MKIKQEQAYNEVLVVLNNMETKYKEKIPKKLINFFKENCAENYNFRINPEIPLKDQKLSRKTLKILAILDLNYWCDLDKKQKLISRYTENETKYQEKIKDKYSVDNLFKRNNENKNLSIIETKINLVQQKEENIIQKIIKNIKIIINKLLKK